MKPKGTVYLVGAGPGDPGLLTVRGAELLGRAEVVVYDSREGSDLLRLAPKSAELIQGKEPGVSDKALRDALIARARQGKTVVRLMTGDPYLSPEGSAEAEVLADQGVPFEVVPGVPQFVAAPSQAGIPLTTPDSSLVTLVGEPKCGAASGVDWTRLANTRGTQVLTVGLDEVKNATGALLKAGMSPDTSMALLRLGSRAQEDTFVGTLATIGEAVANSTSRPDRFLAVIGEVVRLSEKLNWQKRRSLFNRRVIVTRAREQAGQLAVRLRDLGAEVIEIPVIRVEAPTRRQDIVDALLELNSYDWLVFTSPNGVTKFFEYFFKQFHDMRDLGGARIAAVGPGTANRLKELHLQVDLMPDEALAASLAKAFSEFESIENLKICLLRAEVANPELPKGLEALGAIVDDIACYRTVPETEDPGGAAAALQRDGADWVTFTSGSTVEHFHARFDLPAMLKRLPAMKVASIGPETSKTLAALGVKPDVEAGQHTLEGLVQALLEAEKNLGPRPLTPR